MSGKTVHHASMLLLALPLAIACKEATSDGENDAGPTGAVPEACEVGPLLDYCDSRPCDDLDDARCEDFSLYDEAGERRVGCDVESLAWECTGGEGGAYLVVSEIAPPLLLRSYYDAQTKELVAVFELTDVPAYCDDESNRGWHGPVLEDCVAVPMDGGIAGRR